MKQYKLFETSEGNVSGEDSKGYFEFNSIVSNNLSYEKQQGRIDKTFWKIDKYSVQAEQMFVSNGLDTLKKISNG